MKICVDVESVCSGFVPFLCNRCALVHEVVITSSKASS